MVRDRTDRIRGAGQWEEREKGKEGKELKGERCNGAGGERG